MTNTLELKSIMVKKQYTLEKLAKEMGISTTTLSYKVNNKREFKSAEIHIIQKILNLSDEQKESIFFAFDVDWKSTKII